METLVKATGLDSQAPYSLGNKEYYYERECNSGHKNLTDEEIGFAGGYYDGYYWAVPVCLRCVKADKEYPYPNQHSNNNKVHLKEHCNHVPVFKEGETFTGENKCVRCGNIL